MNEKMSIINWMIEHGYQLMGRTKEFYCDNFTVEDLKMFKANFAQYKGIELE